MAETKRVKRTRAEVLEGQRQYYATELAKLADQAKTLHQKAKNNEQHTRKLGELLLTVIVKLKGVMLSGGLKKWIADNIGADISTRNRCNYAMSVASGKRAKNDADKKVQLEEVIAITTALSNLVKSATTGGWVNGHSPDSQFIVIVNAAYELRKKAQAVSDKLTGADKKSLEDLKWRDDMLAKIKLGGAAQQEAIAEWNRRVTEKSKAQHEEYERRVEADKAASGAAVGKP